MAKCGPNNFRYLQIFLWLHCKYFLFSESNDPSRPPIKGCNRKFLHWKLKRIIENIYFRIFTLFLIILDIILVIVDISMNCSWHPVSIIIRNIDTAISVYFVIEVILRIIALTPKVFFRRKSWDNILDFVVVILAFAASIATVIIVDSIDEDDKEERNGYICEKANVYSEFNLLVGIRIFRIFRFVRIIRVYLEHRRMVKGVRQRISENKRRYQVIIIINWVNSSKCISKIEIVM